MRPTGTRDAHARQDEQFQDAVGDAKSAPVRRGTALNEVRLSGSVRLDNEDRRTIRPLSVEP